jgi:hypothetical protein
MFPFFFTQAQGMRIFNFNNSDRHSSAAPKRPEHRQLELVENDAFLNLAPFS